MKLAKKVSILNVRYAVGALLLVLGVLLVANVFPLSTIIFPEEFWYSVFPDGTVDNPTLISPGSTIQLKAQLVYYDGQTGIELPGTYLTWIVQVTVEGETITLSDEVVSPVDGRYATFLFKGTWNVPNVEGKVYAFDWLAIVRDKDRNEVGRSTLTTYAKTSDVVDGYFLINGKNADQESTQVVFSPELDIKFIVTKGASSISRVYVDVYKKGTKITSFNLVREISTPENPVWAYTYTLPGPGTYELQGYFVAGDVSYRKMSLITVWDEEMETTVPLKTVTGVILIVAGLVVALYEPKLRRR